MSQGTFIAGCLVGGFLLFLTAKGRLPTYGAVLFGKTAAPVPSGGGSSGGGGLLGGLEKAGLSAGAKAAADALLP